MNLEKNWQPMPHDLQLSNDYVDLWLVPLEQSPEKIKQYAGYLSEDERRAANRFRMAEKTNESVITRGVLREHLAMLLKVAPESLEFQYENQGKPYLSGQHKNAGVCFNVSHSGEYALIGATLNRNIGVDIEKIRETTECQQLAKRFFSKQETADLLSLPQDQQRAAFFACWTRKESFVKALGKGIMMGLDQFDVELVSAQEENSGQSLSKSLLREVRFDDIDVADWSIVNVPLDHSYQSPYLAAITVAEKNFSLRTWKPLREKPLRGKPQLGG